MIVFGKERNYIIHDEDNVKGFFGPYRWLSNYHLCEIYYGGNMFPATENAYMYSKIDPVDRENNPYVIRLLTCTPSEAGKIGRNMPIRSDWDDVRYDMMKTMLIDKFTRHQSLKVQLMETAPKYLEETNHWKDIYWGVCDGIGENNLGKALMEIRNGFML